MIRKEDALEYHARPKPGKVALYATKPCMSPRDMRLAYLPGATFVARAIAAEAGASFRYTARGNLVGVVSNGSAVTGAGDLGPEAAKPMLEGIAVLMKRLADIDVFDLELDVHNPDALVAAVRAVAPTFGGISLKDIRSPEGLIAHDRLREALSIPVLHENLHGTAVVAAAALSNALELAAKTFAGARVVICGAETVGIGCARLLLEMGVRPENLALYDVRGLVHPDRDDLHAYQRELARADFPPTLLEGLRGADVFVGASTGGVLTAEAIRQMAAYPIVLALATPQPEIEYDEARASRRDVIVATSDPARPNAILDLLSFPYILRGALDVQATRITSGMLLAAVRALAELAREDVLDEVVRAYGDTRLSFGPEYLLPKPIDPRILAWESAAVAAQAVEEGVARHAVDVDAYREGLTVRLGTGRETLRQLVFKARQQSRRVVFADGVEERVLRACRVLVDDRIAEPIVVGAEDDVRASAERFGIDLSGVLVVDPGKAPQREAYADAYYRLRQRRGVTREAARRRLANPEYFAALMLRSKDADVMLSGLRAPYTDSLRTILEVIGTAPGIRRVSSHHIVLRPDETYFLADCAVNIDPSAEDLAEIALLTARKVRALGIEPRVAMLSFSNFGSVDHPHARRVREAARIVKERAPELVVDGEMQLSTALDAELRRGYFPFAELGANANVLVFPDLDAGNLALDLLQNVGETVTVGPVLMGARLPAQLLAYGASAADIVNLAATGIVEAASE